MTIATRLPRVSVIIPTWNRGRLVERAVKSALGQSYRNLEVIVVDDGSTDDTVHALLEIRDARLRVVERPHSGLPATGRNHGVALARGRYVAFLDSDDEWLGEKLDLQIAQLEAQPRLSLSYCDAFVEVNGERRGETLLQTSSMLEGRIFGPLVLENFIPTSTVVARRSALRIAGGFDESTRLKTFEDYDLWLRIALRGEVGCVRRPLAVYHRHPGNLAPDLLHNNLKRRAILKRFLASCGDLSIHENKTVRAGMALVLKNMGRECLRHSHVRRSRAFLGSSIRAYPLQLASYLFLLASYLGQRGSAKIMSLIHSGRT